MSMLDGTNEPPSGEPCHGQPVELEPNALEAQHGAPETAPAPGMPHATTPDAPLPPAETPPAALPPSPAPRKKARHVWAPAHRARKRARLYRKLVGLTALLGPMLWIVGADLVRRGPRIVAHDVPHRWAYLGSAAESAVAWGLLLYLASRPRRVVSHVWAAIFVALFTLVVGVQGAFRSMWNIYLSFDTILSDERYAGALTGDLPLGRPIVLAELALAAAAAALLVRNARRWVRPRRIPFYLAFLLMPGAAYATARIPVSYQRIQSSTPDMIYVHALVGLWKVKTGRQWSLDTQMLQRRTPERVPPLAAKPARPRNVLFVLEESQRADVTCVEYVPDCKLATPDSNAAAPGRLPLLQLRSNASSTSISATTLWSGLRPTASRAATEAAPLLWDYARAAGYDTAYVSGQSLMYANFRFLLQDTAIEHLVGATHIDTEADFWVGPSDTVVSDAALAELAKLKEPFFAVVHYSNIHAPRVYDSRYAPFQPIDMGKPSPKNERYKNYYKDVVYASDLAVGRLLRGLRESEIGKRTVVVFTADHGESYHERTQQGDHGGSAYDEEIRVPGYVDAPPGTLSEAEEAAIRGKKDAYVWHVDLAPTMLDLLGVWDDPAMAHFKERMMGHPVTRPELTLDPVPMSNVAWSWEYRKPNWGLMQGSLKIQARDMDSTFHCFDLAKDPGETRDLGQAGCPALWAAATKLYPVFPPKFGRLRNQKAWGDP
jgi:glucan phosphoethanolaminetransferase (alkaline phosphatase superfamily)